MHVPPSVQSVYWFVFDPKWAAVNDLNSVWSSTSLCGTPVGTPNPLRVAMTSQWSSLRALLSLTLLSTNLIVQSITKQWPAAVRQPCARVTITAAASCEVSPQGAGDTILYRYPYPEPVYTGCSSVHWNATGMPLVGPVYTGIPLGHPANTCRVLWNTTGKT